MKKTTVLFSRNRTLTPEQWHSFWLDRFRKALDNQPVTDDERDAFVKGLERFMGIYGSAPKFVPIDELEAFANSCTMAALDAVGFFYRQVVHSDTHADLLKRIKQERSTKSKTTGSTPAEKSPGIDYVKALTSELKARNYSRRTLRVYVSAVQEYLDSLDVKPCRDDAAKIKAYLIHLRDEREMAPRSVNLAAAAISFFYRHVLEESSAVDMLPRMKPGKDLPNVYGQGDMGKILDSTNNPKHRLVLMLAYGCGLRLAEIAALKPADIDWDRGIISIHGKGSKERILPLDECLVEPIRKYLADNPRQKYLFEGTTAGRPYPLEPSRKSMTMHVKRRK